MVKDLELADSDFTSTPTWRDWGRSRKTVGYPKLGENLIFYIFRKTLLYINLFPTNITIAGPSGRVV